MKNSYTLKSLRERRIEELVSLFTDGDTVIVAELSWLGRNMSETLDLINMLTGMGVKIIFVRQPELSTTGSHANWSHLARSRFLKKAQEVSSFFSI